MVERARSRHIVIVGPSGAGKTSLMGEVERQSGGRYYSVKNSTNRKPRPGESSYELEFLEPDEFEARRPGFLTTHTPPAVSPHAPVSYEYGVPMPPHDPNRVSMRAMPSGQGYIELFRRRLEERHGLGCLTLCQVVVQDMGLLEQRVRARDPYIAPDDLAARLLANRMQPDLVAALGGLQFVNDYPTIGEAGAALLERFDEYFGAAE